MDKVIVSDTPHIRSKITTKRIMLDVCIALLPACIAGCVYFGYKALIVLALSTFCAIATELVYALIQKKDAKKVIREFDFSTVVTGLLLGMTLSSTVPWYVPCLSAVFAVAVVKMLFGGTGKNIVNPAITGRVFAFIAFQGVMISGWANVAFGAIHPSNTIISGATPLTDLLQKGLSNVGVSNLDLFLGTGVMGCIGETCKLALIVGGIYLVIRKVIKWQWPVIYIGVTGLMTVFLNNMAWSLFLPSILSGGLILGAVFMATDYVTSPASNLGRYFYYAVLGILTAVLRKATGIEVVSFAILLMNLLVPIFNKIKPRPFGSKPIKVIIKEKLTSKRVAKKEGN